MKTLEGIMSRGMKGRNSRLASVSLVAVAALLGPLGSAANAQAAAAAPTADTAQPEAIVVTASRITSAGFQAPTPTTVIGAKDLETQAQPNVINTLAELPSINASVTQKAVASATSISGSLLNPRNLGTNRVLVLLDGQRLVGSSLEGSVDVSQIPQALIKRVDVVTGGASASWGSNAVSGVVNFVLDNKFSGFKLNANNGITTYGDDPTHQVQMAAGSDLFDHRAHIVFSADYTYDGGVHGDGDRPWYTAEKVIPRSIGATPPGQPQYIRSSNVFEDQVSPGGIITSGPLKGTYFGAGGAPHQFVYGSNVSDPFMIGGTDVDLGQNLDLDSQSKRANLYSRFSFDIGPSTTLWASGLYSWVRGRVDVLQNLTFPGSLTIQCDNAYLPASVTAGCAANGIKSFGFGTSSADMPPSYAINTRALARFAAGADGDFQLFGSKWSWDLWGEYSSNSVTTRYTNTILTPLYNLAIDAVRGPGGQIVCRSAAAQAAGCIPLNIIGTGVANPAAINWVEGNGAEPSNRTFQRQEAASFTLNGQPLKDWAGPVSIATGMEYRKESFDVRSIDAFSTSSGGNSLLSTAGNNWFQGNTQFANGQYNVVEGFIETGIPLLDSKTLGKFDVSLAAREEKFSTAGWFTTWKAGFTYETPIRGLRLRGLRSRDVRAPGLNELFTPLTLGRNTVVDDFAPNAGKTFQVANVTSGNTALKPERSDNTQIGVVYQPSWLPGFNASVDYWKINVKDGITTLTPQQIIDVCFAGNTAVCSNITRDGTGVISQINTAYFNLSSQKTDGIDFEVSYRRRLDTLLPQSWHVDGALTVRVLATDTFKLDSDPGIPGLATIHAAGQLQTGRSDYTTPNWRILGTQNLDLKNWGLSFTERWSSAMVINNYYIQCTTNCPISTALNPTINNNHIPSTLYFDIGGYYQFTKNLQMYFKVNNVTNADPTLSPIFNGRTNINEDGVTGELLGRTMLFGVRVQY
jgi:outer membrane receptor protein involved in Fe transport